MLLPILLRGDGGKLILHASTNNETISVFADPFPMRAHQPCDISILVQRGGEPVLDGPVEVRLGSASVEATHADATNKLLFAAILTPERSGDFNVTATHDGRSVSGSVTIYPQLPRALTYWPYFAAVPIVIGLFVLNRYLEGRRQRFTSV